MNPLTECVIAIRLPSHHKVSYQPSSLTSSSSRLDSSGTTIFTNPASIAALALTCSPPTGSKRPWRLSPAVTATFGTILHPSTPPNTDTATAAPDECPSFPMDDRETCTMRSSSGRKSKSGGSWSADDSVLAWWRRALKWWAAHEMEVSNDARMTGPRLPRVMRRPCPPCRTTTSHRATTPVDGTLPSSLDFSISSSNRVYEGKEGKSGRAGSCSLSSPLPPPAVACFCHGQTIMSSHVSTRISSISSLCKYRNTACR